MIVTFKNMLLNESPVFVALTTQYIDIIPVNSSKKSNHLELSKIIKLNRAADDIIVLEYTFRPESSQQIFLEVVAGGPNANEILKEIHLQMSFIRSKQ